MNAIFFRLDRNGLEKVVEDFDAAAVTAGKQEVCIVDEQDTATVFQVFDVFLDAAYATICEIYACR